MNRTQYSSPQARPAAFTLVEMLTIIAVIVLLVCILVPSIYAGLTQAKRVQSQAILDMLDKGCQLYRDDFREFPPSGGLVADGTSTPLSMSWSTSTSNVWAGPLTYQAGGADRPITEGRHLLVVYLTGYSDTDLQSGYGYRVAAKSATYGPYADTERLKTLRLSGTVNIGGSRMPAPELPPVFVDAFDNPIYYYRYDARGGSLSYKASDNTITISGAPTMPNYTYSTSNGSSRYRIGVPQDFVLMTWGPNGTWEAPGTAASSDDITNFGKK